ncbi:hypothetical protein LCGC14_1020520 [marine sediment metagenome]|uniref:Uncharacterized protein n=1 Tax=marine sediment metagenome TaxID=412755 RepID=A0A0F9NJ51_9ZZZZ|nr:hypothetical protein [Candidatus Aminicenantes bacterium]
MKRRKSRLRRGGGWIGLVCSTFFFIGLAALVLLNYGCGREQYDPRPGRDPDMITELGIRVWTNGHDIDPDEIDQIFLERVEDLDHGQPPPFNLIISPTHCREYPDGLTYCGFEDPDFSFMLAGVFYSYSNSIKIHLMNGEWSLEQSALKHEIRHQIMWWFDVPGWDINNKTLAKEN